jgi:Tfp pilus assembly protein PilX
MRRLRDERGIAVGVALFVLLITLTLGGAAVMAATQVNDLSNRDTSSKAAVEAAEAGLRSATYRLNMLGTSDPNCPTVPNATAWDATSRLCQRDGPSADDARWGDSATDDPSSHLGNGATYSYWISAPLTSSDTCAGDNVVNAANIITQRCVTAVGTANGVSARTQARVAAFSAAPLFDGAGIIGRNRITIKPGNGGTASIYATTGTNGSMTLGNNVTIDGRSQSGAAVELGPGATFTPGNNGDILLPSATPTRVDPATLAIQPVATDCQQGGIGAAPSSDTACFGKGYNSDDRIAGCTASGSATVDACSGLTWNASSRSVTVANGGSVTLAGSSLPYNFCNFTTGNNATINIPLGAHVALYIDSNYATDGGDPLGNCPAGTGKLTLGNGTVINNLNPDPLSLQIYVYGTSPPGSNIVTWNNNAQSTYMVLWAPNSTIQMQNNGAFWGGIGGYNVDITNNFTFHWVGDVSSIQGHAQGLYYRSAWRQCPSNPTTSDPRSGC